MIGPMQSILASTLLRTLQVGSGLTPRDAIARIASTLQDVPFLRAGAPAVVTHLEQTASHLRRRGVLNPTWLTEVRGINPYFCLVRAYPGLLQGFDRLTNKESQATRYILFGEWDVLVSMYTVQAELDGLVNRINAAWPNACMGFSASRVLLFHRHRVRQFPEPDDSSATIPFDRVNRIVDDYDEPSTQTQRVWLEARGILLGPTWQLDSQPVTDVSAYVGISPRGAIQYIPPEELLDNLLHDQAVSACLVHFMELTHATPFRFLAKLVCRDFEELDAVTDVLYLGAGSGSLRGVAFETKTFVVGQGSEQMPLVNGRTSRDPVTPDTRGFEALAQSELEPLGPDAIASFNSLDRRQQIVALDSMAELREKTTSWPREWGSTGGAVRAFSEAALGGALPGTFQGPVTEIARVVEAACRAVLEQVVRRVFGRDLGRAQTELGLPTRRFGALTLGEIAAVLRTIQKRDDFEFLGGAMDDEWLEILERFAEERNRWDHSGTPVATTRGGEMKAARQVMSIGLDLLRWLRDLVVPALDNGGAQPVDHVPAPVTARSAASSTGFGIFISYSQQDTAIAERIASELRQLGHQIWYAPWSINPGQSIAGMVNDALLQVDTLLALLSPRSVVSRWVRLEWQSGLALNNAGRDLAVVPVLIDPVDVPPLLLGIKLIDMTPVRFDTGFIELRRFLAARRDGRHRDP